MQYLIEFKTHVIIFFLIWIYVLINFKAKKINIYLNTWNFLFILLKFLMLNLRAQVIFKFIFERERRYKTPFQIYFEARFFPRWTKFGLFCRKLFWLRLEYEMYNCQKWWHIRNYILTRCESIDHKFPVYFGPNITLNLWAYILWA